MSVEKEEMGVDIASDAYQHQLDQAYGLGESNGVQRASDLLASEASRYFLNEKDGIADLLRELSKQLQREATALHDKHCTKTSCHEKI